MNLSQSGISDTINDQTNEIAALKATQPLAGSLVPQVRSLSPVASFSNGNNTDSHFTFTATATTNSPIFGEFGVYSQSHGLPFDINYLLSPRNAYSMAAPGAYSFTVVATSDSQKTIYVSISAAYDTTWINLQIYFIGNQQLNWSYSQQQ